MATKMPSVSLGAKPSGKKSYGKEKGVLCVQGPVIRCRGVKQGHPLNVCRISGII